jgi:predicted kinase
MIRLAAGLLALNGGVVIGFGSWSRRERDQLLAVGRAAGAHVELHVLEPQVDELWRRLSKRNVQPEETPIDRSTLDSSMASWESPDESELSQYDAHYRSR